MLRTCLLVLQFIRAADVGALAVALNLAAAFSRKLTPQERRNNGNVPEARDTPAKRRLGPPKNCAAILWGERNEIHQQCD